MLPHHLFSRVKTTALCQRHLLGYSDAPPRPHPRKKHIPVGGRQKIVVIFISNLSSASECSLRNPD